MATSIEWSTGIISVQRADLTLISGTLYEMDTDAFRLELKSLEAGQLGMPWTDTHVHNTSVTVAGTTFARTVEIISPYSIQFLPDEQWTVRLVGSNNNIFDVENGILIQNQVQVISNNSAGLIVNETQVSGLTTAESAILTEIWQRFGLDGGNPATFTPSQITFAGVTVTISGDPQTSVTLTRAGSP